MHAVAAAAAAALLVAVLHHCCCTPVLPPDAPFTSALEAAPTHVNAHSLAPIQEILRFEGLFAPFWKTLLYHFFGALSGGLLLLLTKWAPHLRIAICLAPCELKDAEFVRIVVSKGWWGQLVLSGSA